MSQTKEEKDSQLQFTPTQALAVADTHKFRVVCCGRQWGKTTIAKYEMVAFGVSRDDVRICYIAPTFQQARDILWEQLKDLCKPVTVSINETRLEIEVRTQQGGTSVISLRGWESIETLRGLQFDFIAIDEVASMRNFQENWQAIIRPTLLFRNGSALFISTPKGFNHFYDLYCLETKDNNYKSFKFTTYDNPFIPAEEIEKAKQETDEDFFAQEYLADFRKYTGLVFKSFDRGVHVKNFEVKTRFAIEIGQDFGFTNPTAAIFSYFDDDDNWYIFDEYYEKEKPISEHAGRLLAKRAEYSNPEGAKFGDSEDPQSIEEYARWSWYLTPVVKDYDSILKGISRIEERMKINAINMQPKVFIHPRCENLIYELERYHWKEKKSSDVNEKDRPDDGYDHLIDAARYIINMHVAQKENIIDIKPVPAYVPMGGYRQKEKKKYI